MKKLVLLLFLLIPITVHAESSFSIQCDQTVFKEFSDFTCRLLVKGDSSFNKIEFDIETSEGLSLEDVRSNYRTLWNVKQNKNTVIASTVHSGLVSGTQEFGILLFETMGSGDQTINIKNITLSGDKTFSIKGVSEKVTVLSSENKLKGIFVNNESIPKFVSTISNYKVEIPSDITEIQIDAIALDVTAVIEGTGNIELDINQSEFVVPINVKSASGTNKAYYITLKRKDTPNLDITSSNILIYNGKELVPFKFDPYIFEYNIEVPDNVESLNIEATANNGFSFVKKYGTRTVDIIDGDNVVLIKVKNNSGQIKTYVLNITRILSNKSANYYLKDLTIKGYKLKFNKRVKKYELAIKKGVTVLEINAVADYKNSNITIVGNENLKENSVINIIVTAENGSKLTYQITIKYKPFNYSFLIILIIILSIASFYYDWRKKKPKTIKKKLAPLLLITPKVEEKKIEVPEVKNKETVINNQKGINKKVSNTKKKSETGKHKTGSKKSPAKKASSVKKTTNTKGPKKSTSHKKAVAKKTVKKSTTKKR